MTHIKLTMLSQAQIASPCSMRWEDMSGDDKRRYCAHCNLHVHNLSAMNEREAEALLEDHFGPRAQANIDGKTSRFCATIFRRADGTILTKDCPVGFAAARARARRAMARGVLALGGLFASAAALGLMPRPPWQTDRLRDRDPFARIAQWLDPLPTMSASPLAGKMIMGDVCAPAPPSAPRRLMGEVATGGVRMLAPQVQPSPAPREANNATD